MTSKSMKGISTVKFERPPESLVKIIGEGLSCTKPSHKDWEGWVLFWVYGPQHKVAGHTEKQGNMAQTMEQNK